jgi:hypothetical protein
MTTIAAFRTPPVTTARVAAEPADPTTPARTERFGGGVTVLAGIGGAFLGGLATMPFSKHLDRIANGSKYGGYDVAGIIMGVALIGSIAAVVGAELLRHRD